jgi:hypothetical protein
LSISIEPMRPSSRNSLVGTQIGVPIRSWPSVTWDDNSVSSCRSYSRAKGPGTSAGVFPMALSLSRGVPGVLGGVRRGPVGPPGPRGLAALSVTSTPMMIGALRLKTISGATTWRALA